MTELNIANQQIQDLQGQYNAQKQEVERLRNINVELEERCQAAELQINAISSQYRSLLQKKEHEINELKQKCQHGVVDTILPILPSSTGGSERGYDDADFIDLISSSQREINRLATGDVRRQRADKDHRKQLADGSAPITQEFQDGVDPAQNTTLHTIIQELERKLQDTVDEHQHHLTTLQDHYTTQLHQQQEQYGKEIEILNDSLNYYKQQCSRTEGDSEISEINQIVKEKKELEKLKEEIKHTKSYEKEKERQLRLVNHQLEKVQAEKLQYQESYKVAQNTISNLQQQLTELQGDHDEFLQDVMSKGVLEKEFVDIQHCGDNNELHQLKKELEDAKKRIEELESENEKVCSDIYATKLRLLAQLEKHHADTSEVLHDIQEAQQRINNETMNSHVKLLHEKQNIVGEMVQINEQKIELEKQLQTLQKKNSAIALDIKSIIETLGSLEHGDISNLVQNLDSETSILKSYNEELWKCVSQLDKTSCSVSSEDYEKSDETVYQQSESGHSAFSNKNTENLLVDTAVYDDFDHDSLTSSMSELSVRNRELDIQVKGLQQQIETYEREIEHFELVRSDWQTERQAMEELLLSLRAQLRMKEESLSVITAEKGLIAVKKKYPKDIQFIKLPAKELEECDDDNMLEKVEEQIEELMQSNAQLESEREVLLAEKNGLLEEVSTLRNLNQNLTSKINESAEDQNKSKNNEEEFNGQFNEMLIEKEAEICTLMAENQSLEDSLVQLDQQHQEEIEEFLNLKTNLTENNKQLKTEINQLKNSLEQKEKENGLMKTEIETMQEHLTSLVSISERKHNKLFNVSTSDNISTESLQEENTESQKEADSQKIQNETMQSILNAFHTINSDNVHLEEHITSLEENRKHFELRIEELKEKNENLNFENQKLSIEIKNLKGKEEALKEENETMKREFENIKQSTNETTDIDKSDSIINELKSKLEDLETSKEDLEREISVLGEEAQTLKNIKTEQEMQIFKLQNEISEINNSYSVDDVNEKTKLENQLKQSYKNVEQMTKDMILKDDEIENLKQLLEEKECEIEILKEDAGNINPETLLLDNNREVSYNRVEKSLQVNLTVHETERITNELKILQEKYLECKKKLEDRRKDTNICTENILISKDQNTHKNSELSDFENWKETFSETSSLKINKSIETTKSVTNSDNNLIRDRNNIQFGGENSKSDLQNIITEQKQQIENLKMKLQSINNENYKSADNNVVSNDKYKITEDKVRQLEIEKEQMLSVLNEKTRECSNLKNEVHRLVNVVSTEKNALIKLQQDNQELIQRKGLPDQEMTKEAVQNLCRIVRDKDLEIEALNQKINSLLTVIQQSSPDSDHIIELLKERETLMKQLSAYKSDREQIINALNQKHQESTKYHSEIQKLNSLLAAETYKLNTLIHNHESVSQQYEEKQKSLVNTQNEVIGLKRRVSDLERQHEDLEQKYSDMLNNKKASQMADITKEELNSKLEEIDKLQTLLKEKEKWIFEKDNFIHELSQDLQKASDNLKQKENEVSILQRQTENLVMHLKDTKDDLNATKDDEHNAHQQISNLQSEIALMKELNERLSMTVQEKEFEIKALQEKLATFTLMIQEKTNEAGDTNRILAESEAMQQKAQQFHHERDEALLALSQRQQETEELKNEVQRLKEREERLSNELQRLRDHLLQVEEGYTKEALNAEEREKALRNRLSKAEEQARMSSTAIHNANQHANLQMESLQEQLTLIAKQRDRALDQVSEYEDKVQQYVASLGNLQLVLEQFQKERERDMQAVVRQHQAALSKEKQKTQDLLAEIWQKEEQLSEATEALDAASRLSEQLDSKEEIIIALREEVSKITIALQKAQDEIRNFQTNTEGKVDRQIMKNLVLGYFSAPLGQKPDVIRLLARVLDFNQEEMSKAGIRVGRESAPDGNISNSKQKSSGWISGLFKKNTTEQSSGQKQESAHRKTESEQNKSFSALFVQFLENESQPQVQVPLPAEDMARELTRRSSHHLKSSRINPFNSMSPQPSNITPPRSPSKDVPRNNMDHPLIRPISSSLPMFTPILVASNDNSAKTNTFLKEVLN